MFDRQLVRLVDVYDRRPPPALEQGLRDAFECLDRDNSGHVYTEDLRHLLTSVGESLTVRLTVSAYTASRISRIV